MKTHENRKKVFTKIGTAVHGVATIKVKHLTTQHIFIKLFYGAVKSVKVLQNLSKCYESRFSTPAR